MNAHVDTFNEPPVAVLLGVFRQTAIYVCGCVALFGAWVVCVYRTRALPEPHFGKPQRTRTPFLYSYKIGVAISRLNKAKLQKIIIGVCMEELSKKLDPIMVELNRVYKEKYPNKGCLDKRVIDVPMDKTQKVQIITVGETDKIESDVVFVLSKNKENIVAEIPFMDSKEEYPDDAFNGSFLKKALEILESKTFENRLGLFYKKTSANSPEEPANRGK